MLHAAITLPGGIGGVWTLLVVPAAIVVAAIGGAVGILLTRREQRASRASGESAADRDGS